MPTSVLLAVLAAAGLLALAPALVRRYDATERLVAERALSTARVLARAGVQPGRRRRTVPGRRPVNPPRVLAQQVAGAAAFAAGAAVFVATSAVSVTAAAASPPAPRSSPKPVEEPTAPPAEPVPAAPQRPRVDAHTRMLHRRRRTLLILTLLNLLEIAGAVLLGSGFVIALSVTSVLLLAYVVHLRNRALVERRRRRAEERYARWVARHQAAVRREQARRAAQRRELLERQLAAREEERRALMAFRPPHGRAAGE